MFKLILLYKNKGLNFCLGDFVIVKEVVWVIWLFGFIINWENIYLGLRFIGLGFGIDEFFFIRVFILCLDYISFELFFLVFLIKEVVK